MKVAIIGAGTIGLYLGWKLGGLASLPRERSEKGNRVVVFEKKNEIGNEVCSGLFSKRILEFFPESEKLVKNKIKYVLLHFPKKTIKIEFSKEFLLMSHYELDKLVFSLAEKAGAEIILNKNINNFPEGFDRIIGCDGANSFVRRKLKLSEPNFRLGIQGFVKEKNFDDFVEVWPIKEGFAPLEVIMAGKKHKTREPLTGFVWKIPRGEETEYGIIACLDSADFYFKKFLEKNNLSLEKIKAKIIPQGFIIPKNSLITLCGDSAGLTKPWSGGGVIWGLKAADILLKNFPDFLKYKKEAKRFFIPKIYLSEKAVKLVYFLGFKAPWLLPKKITIESDFLI